MKNIFAIVAGMVVLAFPALFAQGQGLSVPSEMVQMGEEDKEGEGGGGMWSDTTLSGFHLEWMVDSTDMFHIAISAPTTGWVAVGFNPSTMKKDADLIIGYVKGDSVFIQDNFGVSAVLHEPDTSLGGTDDVHAASGSEEDGVTRIAFSIPLDSGDKYDQKLARGESVKVILACAPNGADDFISIHRSVASVTVEIK